MDMPAEDFDALGPCFAADVLPVDDLLDLDIAGLIDEEELDAPAFSRKDFLPSSSSSSSPSPASSFSSSSDDVGEVGRPSNCLRESQPDASCSFGQGDEALYHPPDELAELDWLFPFVDDSYSMEDKSIMPLLSMSYGELEEEENRTGASKDEATKMVGGFPFTRDEGEGAAATVAKAARSKRARSGGRVWALQMEALKKGEAQRRRRRRTEEEQEEEEGGSESSSCLDFAAEEEEEEGAGAGAGAGEVKKKGRKRRAGAAAGAEEAPRRCSHCQVQKTPQWRAGPCGPKSLCNACGVRYKSGRLLPEYRPAASPTFLTARHSNSHKKVLEMRRVKLEEQAPCGNTPSPSSCLQP